jgi:ribosome recycling factor
MATVQETLAATDSKMTKSVEALQRELGAIRTGRASPALVETAIIDYYGVPTVLNQIASISVPEARVLLIQPWDKQALKDVEKGLLKTDLGLVPNNDGNVIRINIPVPTEERRRELVRLVGKKIEEAHVSVRNVRRDGQEEIRRMERDKELSQDETRKAQEQLQRLTDSYIGKMDSLRKEKEVEVMEV